MVERGGPKAGRWPVVLLSVLVPVLAQAIRKLTPSVRSARPSGQDPEACNRRAQAFTRRDARVGRRAQSVAAGQEDEADLARVVEAEEVGKKFQTADHAVEKARAGYWLCAGVAGEPWFQPLEKIKGKYEPAGEEVKTFGFDERPRSYRIFKPKATTRNWVAQIKGPGIAGFFIRPNYDPAHLLYSPAGGTDHNA